MFKYIYRPVGSLFSLKIKHTDIKKKEALIYPVIYE